MSLVRRRGFALIELLITMAILAVLAGAAMSFVDVAAQRSKEQDLRAALRDIRQGIDAYKAASDAHKIAHSADETGYPRSLDELTQGVTDTTSVKGLKLYFLRRLPRDPFADPALPADQTWGLRSYASPPDDPQPGRDIYDVYSLSPRRGLNGQPYRDW